MLAPRLLRAVLCLPLGGSSREHPYIYAIPHCPLDLYLSSLSLSCYRYVVQTASLPSKPRMFATSIGEVRCPSHRRESPRPRKVRRFIGAPWGSFCVPESTSLGIPVRVCPRSEMCTAGVAPSSLSQKRQIAALRQQIKATKDKMKEREQRLAALKKLVLKAEAKAAKQRRSATS